MVNLFFVHGLGLLGEGLKNTTCMQIKVCRYVVFLLLSLYLCGEV